MSPPGGTSARRGGSTRIKEGFAIATRSVRAVLIIAALFVVIGAAAPLPPLRPGVVQDERRAPLSDREQTLLTQVLAGMAPVQFKVALVETVAGEDPSDYVERLFKGWGLGRETVLILVAQREGRVRLMLGGAYQLPGEEITRLATAHYVPLATAGKTLLAVAGLARAVRDRLVPGAPAPAPPTAPADPVPAPPPPPRPRQAPAPAAPVVDASAGLPPAARLRGGALAMGAVAAAGALLWALSRRRR